MSRPACVRPHPAARVAQRTAALVASCAVAPLRAGGAACLATSTCGQRPPWPRSPPCPAPWRLRLCWNTVGAARQRVRQREHGWCRHGIPEAQRPVLGSSLCGPAASACTGFSCCQESAARCRSRSNVVASGTPGAVCCSHCTAGACARGPTLGPPPGCVAGSFQMAETNGDGAPSANALCGRMMPPTQRSSPRSGGSVSRLLVRMPVHSSVQPKPTGVQTGLLGCRGTIMTNRGRQGGAQSGRPRPFVMANGCGQWYGWARIMGRWLAMLIFSCH